MNQHYRLFIGNPGVGKSTLVNCLAQKVLFKSGVSIGSGMTYQMERQEHDGIVYMDTPGLADIKIRKAAAEAITKALKQNGIYQIFFVVTLEAGRVRPQDLVTIKLVLENAKDIKYYSLIVNKLTKRLYQEFLKDEKAKLKELVAELNFGVETNAEPPAILLLLRDNALDDADNVFTEMELLKDFVNNAPNMAVFPDHVNDIPGDDSFDKIATLFEKQLSQLRQDNQKIKAKIEETEQKYRKISRKSKLVHFFHFLFFRFFNVELVKKYEVGNVVTRRIFVPLNQYKFSLTFLESGL